MSPPAADAPLLMRSTSRTRYPRVLAVCLGRAIGAALFEEGRLAVALALESVEGSAGCPPCPLCRSCSCPHEPGQAARLVGDLLGGLEQLGRIDAALIERPTFWRRSGTPPLLGQSAGIIAGALLSRGVAPVTLLAPRDWKGRGFCTQSARVRSRCWYGLDGAERTLVPRNPRTGRYDGDAIAACGLALWSVGRLRTEPR